MGWHVNECSLELQQTSQQEKINLWETVIESCCGSNTL